MRGRHVPSVLFLCTGNSCRSQMAEGWARALWPDRFRAHSAGLETHGLNPHAVAVMAEAGAFSTLGAREVARITYLGLGSDPKPSSTEITQDLITTTREEFHSLIAAYGDPDKGYPARRALFEEREASDFDHLSRYGEWTMQDAPVVLKIGGDDAL